MKKFLIIGGIALVLIIGLVTWIHHRRARVHYITSPVTRGDLTSFVEETGTLDPIGITTVTVSGSTATVTGGVTVGAQVTGLITKVYVGFNSRVKKGQILAQIDPSSYQAVVDEDKASLSNAEYSLQQSEINVDSAIALLRQDQAALANSNSEVLRDEATMKNDKINYGREVELLKHNYDSRQNLDNARYAYYAERSTVDADQASVAQAKEKVAADRIALRNSHKAVDVAGTVIQQDSAKLRDDSLNLSYTHIVSPVNGTVINSNVAVGQTVVSSFQAPSLFVIAQDLKKMQIDTLVDEADIAKIKVGEEADFNVGAFPSSTFHGKVTEIRLNPINQANVVDYDVIVVFDNPGEKLLPGMQADVKFIVAQAKNTLKIPTMALRFVPPQEREQIAAGGVNPQQNYQPHVWVLQRHKAVMQNVKLGIASDSETQIVSGLREREKVITGIEQQKQGPRNLLF